jgi:hypothetical protein
MRRDGRKAEPLMGDKSPKSTQKQASQKQAKSGAAQKKKGEAEAIRLAAIPPKK